MHISARAISGTSAKLGIIVTYTSPQWCIPSSHCHSLLCYTPRGEGASVCRKKECKINGNARLGRTRHISLLEAVHVYPSPSQALPVRVSMHWEQQECFGGGREGQEGKMLGYDPHCILKAVLLCALVWWTKQTGVIHVLGLMELSDKQALQKTAITSDVVACMVWKFLVLGMFTWVWSPRISSGSIFPLIKNTSRTYQQICVSLGLNSLARAWCSWKIQRENGSQVLLGQGRSLALNTEMNWDSCSWFAFFQGLNCFALGVVGHSGLLRGQNYKAQLLLSPNHW